MPGDDDKMERAGGTGFDFDAEWSIGPRSRAWDALWRDVLSKVLFDKAKGHARPKTNDKNDSSD